MEMIDWIRPAIMGFVVLVFVGGMVFIIGSEVREVQLEQSLDEVCYRLEKIRYCDSFGMELGSIVVTPGGLFGGSPYNKEACVSEHSEKIIKFRELNWEKCKS